MKMPPWSISSLTSFETCPKRYYHIKVARDVKDSGGEAAEWGTWCHTQIENRLRDSTPLPATLAGYEPLVAPIAAAPGQKMIEHEMAITEDLKPCDWKADDTWCRAIVDAGIIYKDKALLWDWKTGKRKPDSAQLKLSAALTMHHFPQVQTVQTAFVWLKDKATDKATFTRNDLSDIWQYFTPRVSRVSNAYGKAHWPPKPSGLCRKHCPVPKHLCDFSGA